MVRAAGGTSCSATRSSNHSGLPLLVPRRKRVGAIAVALRDGAVLVLVHQLGMPMLCHFACARDRVGFGFMQRSGALTAGGLHRPTPKRPRLDCETPFLRHGVFFRR